MKAYLTNRGFVRMDFEDRYGQACSCQESSLASERAVWLGCDVATDGQESSRMHLTQAMVGELLPILEHFHRTGDLPRPPAEPRIQEARE